MKQIIVKVSGLTTEEKQRVNEALAKIKGVQKLPAINPGTEFLFAPLSSDMNKVSWSWHSLPEAPTHTTAGTRNGRHEKTRPRPR